MNALTGVEGLRVAARSSAFRFKGGDHDLQAVGREIETGELEVGCRMVVEDDVAVGFIALRCAPEGRQPSAPRMSVFFSGFPLRWFFWRVF